MSSNAEKLAEYDALLALVLRMGAWLTGEKAQMLDRATWEEQFARYQDQLERLRVLGDELRPKSLRPRPAPSADALTLEVMELFATEI